MKNRLLLIGILVGFAVGVGAMLWSAAREQVGGQRAELMGELLAGGAE
jgi:hypothetical protein